ncbi:MAG: hypothetical protein KDJ77_07195, partial [Rhodobiaceae bacterium]|nr:hypothetical protein [Rhodobiaceae bacterium]
SRYDLAVGTYTFTVGGVGEATGEYKFKLRDLSDNTPITSGAAVSGQFDTGLETNVYSIDVSAGERLVVDAQSLTEISIFDVGVRILDPFGQEVFDQGFYNNGGTPDRTEVLYIPGTYTVLLEGDRQTTSAANYTFVVTTVPEPAFINPDGTQAFTVGDQVNGSITADGQIEDYAFNVTQGGLYFFDSHTTSGIIQWSLFSPHSEDGSGGYGDPVFFYNSPNYSASREVFEASSHYFSGGDRIFYLSPGKHVIRVHSRYVQGTGDYSFTLKAAADGQAITYGEDVTGTLDPASGLEIYTFDGNAGDIIRLERTLPTSATGDVNFQLFDEEGHRLTTDYGGSTNATYGILRTHLPRTGKYTVIVQGPDYRTGTRDYAFNIDRVTDQTDTLVFGETKSGTLETGGEHTYTFDVANEMLLGFDAIVSDGLRWTLTGPNGDVVTNRSFNSDAFYPVAWPVTPGSYTFKVFGSNNDSGDYGFRLIDIMAAPEITLDQVVNYTGSALNASDAYKIDIPDGTRFTIDLINSHGGWSYWTLYRATGEEVARQRTDGDAGPYIAVGDETYYLVINQRSDGRSVVEDFDFAFHTARTTEQALTLGTYYTAEIEHPNDRARYTFSLTDAKTVYFDTLYTASSNARFTLTGPDGVIANQSYADRDQAGNLFKLGPGDYTLEILGVNDLDFSNTFRLVDVDAEPLLALNTTDTIALTPSRSNGFRRIEITEGQSLYFTRDNPTGHSNHYMRLYGPDGKEVWLTNGDRAEQVYAKPGIYTLVVEGYYASSDTDPGSLDVGVYEARTIDAAMTPGALVTGSISRPDETRTYSFDVATAGRYHFDSRTNNGSISWSVRETSTGATYASRAFNSQTSNREAVFDLPAGSYEVVVTGSGKTTGDFGFRLSALADAPAIARDTQIDAVFPNGQESVLYSFDAAIGDTLSFDAISLVGSDTDGGRYRVRVIDPLGNEVISRSFSDQSNYIVRVAGTYRLIIDQTHAAAGASGATTASFMLVDGGAATANTLTGMAIDVGVLVEDAITVDGGSAGYVFTLTDETRLVFDSQTNNSALHYLIEDAYGTRVSERAFSTNDWDAYGVLSSDSVYALTLPAGTYRVAVRANSGTQGSYAFRLIDLEASAAGNDLTRKTPVTATIDPGNGRMDYRFTGSAGETVFISGVSVLNGTSGTGDFQVIGPDGNVVKFDGVYTSFGFSDRTLEPLKLDGEYILSVIGRQNVTTPFNVTFDLDTVTVRDVPLTLDTEVTGSITEDVETVRYTFTLNEAKKLLLDSHTPITNIDWRLMKDGNQVAGNYDLYFLDLVSEGYLDLAAGDYALEIFNRSQVKGDFAFELRDLGSAPAIAIGDEVTLANTATVPGRAFAFTFDATQGVPLYLDTVNVGDFQYDIDLGIISPSGDLIRTANYRANPDFGVFDPQETGTYMLVGTFSPTWTAVGTASLRLNTFDTTTQALAIDTTVTGELTVPGDEDIYTFTVTDGGPFYFDSRTYSQVLYARIENDRGQVFSTRLDGDNGVSGYVALPAGDYRVVVYGSDDGGTGEYRFQLKSVASADPAPAGSYLEGTLTPGNETRLYTFDANAGDRFFLDVLTASGSAERKIYDPFGKQIDSQFFAYDLEGLELKATGTYLIVVGGASSRVDDSTFTYNIITTRDAAPVTATPLPAGANLQVENLAVTGTVRAGSNATVTWTTRNAGSATAAGHFVERLIVRNEDIGAIIAVVDLPYDGSAIGANATRSRTATVALPSGSPGAGNLSFTVITDALNVIAEPTADGLGEKNRTSITVESALDTLPDLVVENVTVTPADDWEPGDTVTVTWTTRNAGGLATNAQWTEQVRVRNTLRNAEIFLTDLDYDGSAATGTPLGAGESVTRSVDIVWPGGINATGTFNFVVTTDIGDAVLEANDTDTGESNNATTETVVSAADLVVQNLHILETSPTAGGTITIVWDTVNQGSAATPSGWPDRVRVYSYNTGQYVLDTSILYDQGSLGPLEPGARVTRQLQMTLPEGLAGSNRIWIAVEANRSTTGATTIVEALASGGNGVFNNQASIEIQSAERQYADLQISAMTAPTDGQGGEDITVAWTVTNAGLATTATSWTDRVVLSADDTIGNGDDIVLGSFARNGALANGGTYSRSETFTLPLNLDGNFKLAVVVDVDEEVLEPDTRGDNTEVRDFRLDAPRADLVTEVVVGPSNANWSDTINVSWRVGNIGEATATGPWADEVFLSTDTVLSGSDISLGTVNRTAPLAVGNTYTVNSSFALPGGISGTYYLLVKSDTDGVVFENGLTENNVRAAVSATAIAIAPSPNLAASDVTAPDKAVPGEPVTIAWTVTNAGAGTARAPWADRVYLSDDGTFASAFLVGTVNRAFDLPTGDHYDGRLDLTLPNLAPGDYTVFVVADWQNRVYEGGIEDDNRAESPGVISVAKPNLAFTGATANGTVTSGDSLTIDFEVENNGLGAATGSWRDVVYLSSDATIDAGDLVLGSFDRTGPLAVNGTIHERFDADIPIELFGDYFLLISTDANGTVIESDEGDNVTVLPLAIDLAEHADLVVSNVTAPAYTARDPATITVGWTVTNSGTGVGAETGWVDRIMASYDDIIGDGDDFVLATRARTAPLALGDSYTASVDVVMGPRFSRRLTVYVVTDADNTVFEAGSKANNKASVPHPVDIMPQPYADLVVTDISADATGQSGQLLTVGWTVVNQGIGVTDRSSWTDTVRLYADAGLTTLLKQYQFNRIGELAPDGSYDRTAQILLPDGIEGKVYLQVTTGGPFEFIYTTNNASDVATSTIQLSPSPDLIVEEISATPDVVEGGVIDIAWRVKNQGLATAEGSWTDTVILRPLDTTKPPIVVGNFTTDSAVAAGLGYQRTERFVLPTKIEGPYRVVVTTNSRGTIYEHGAAQDNNVGEDDDVVLVSVLPRPDLQVGTITATSGVTAGGTIQATFEIINQGSVDATGLWYDRAYLSLDAHLSSDDVLIGTFQNGSALANGESYVTQTGFATVPVRFGGDAYIIVSADSFSQLDEYPNDGNNIETYKININPAPKPDLVMSNVVSPSQAVAGSEIEVRYKVTNKGVHDTYVGAWQDTIWIARDPRRPNTLPKQESEGGVDFSKGNSAIYLGKVTHTGLLDIGDSYEVTLRVTLPTNLASGTYYITPWTDSSDLVVEDTLAININPDDPNEFDSNNYKGRMIEVIGYTPPRPDLIAVGVTTAKPVVAGQEALEVTWTVENQGSGNIDPTVRWLDEILLSDSAVLGASGSKTWSLGRFEQTGGLAIGDRYSRTELIDLPPSAKGLYVHVVTDVTQRGYSGITEEDETNNLASGTASVTNEPADLHVVSVNPPATANTGDTVTVSWTVENLGADVWDGTQYWLDAVWISPDPVLDLNRATRLARVPVSLNAPLASGERYTMSTSVEIPAGIEGPYFIHVITDSDSNGHRPESEYDSGSASFALSHYTDSVFESDTANNYGVGDIDVTYTEPNLKITAVSIPPDASSGSDIDVSFTVTNIGGRAATADDWPDRVFISTDGALDAQDHLLAEFKHEGGLEAGDSYTVNGTVTLPVGIEGPFYLVFETDSGTRSGGYYSRSNIGIGLTGVRASGENAVREFRDEGDNLASAQIEIELAEGPNLIVSSLSVPDSHERGQLLHVSYSVSNTGGADTPASQSQWTDLVYLSRDENLDPTTDLYLGAFDHKTGLAAGDSYTIDHDFRINSPILGSYYLFVVTDRATAVTPNGAVFEAGRERDNTRSSATPINFKLPPPADLSASGVTVSGNLTAGEQATINWRVDNVGTAAATGGWTDAVYLSKDNAWDINDILIGRLDHSGNLAANGFYTASLTATMPVASEGNYRFIVRSDVRDTVFEDGAEANNTAISENSLYVFVDEIALGSGTTRTLAPNGEQVVRVTVGIGETLRVRLLSDNPDAQNEIYVRYGDVPTPTNFDAIYGAPLSADQTAIIGETLPGDYYILIRNTGGISEPTAVTVLPEILPFQVIDITQDQGGDSRFVTATITGAGFKDGAVVRLTRPGVAAYEPVRSEV